MLSHLLVARSAMAHTSPDLSRHAAVRCMYGNITASIGDSIRRPSRRLTQLHPIKP